MSAATSDNIHVRSFREFVERGLPEALGAVAPISDYRVEWIGEGKGRIAFRLKEVPLAFEDLPFPLADGSFVAGSGRVVVMTASSNNLEEAEIKAVGEQLMEEIAPRLAPPPVDAEWDEEFLRAWFPLDRWLEEMLLEGGIPTSQWLDVTNPVARATHLRRIVLLGGEYSFDESQFDRFLGGDASFHPSQIGRVDPLETPEGPNTGRVFTLARSAEVRDGNIVPASDQEEGTLGPAASLIPLLCHDDATRALMGANMIRQMIPPRDPEPPLVRSGLEPEDGSAWLGRNFLTAFLHWKGMTYEDAIVMSESAAQRFASPPWSLEVGDKFANRHGAKGVIGAILPDEEMPHLPDGRAVELVFDSMGVYSRLNFGQILEAALGLVAEKRGEAIIAPPFRRMESDELHALLREAGLPESGQFVLTDGKDGSTLDEPTTVGLVYWGQLVHQVRTKLHAVGPGEPVPPPFKGQRVGAMEYLALRAMGAHENIADAYLTRAVPKEESRELLHRVSSGFLAEHADPPTRMFRRLQRSLRTAMIEMEFTGDSVQFRWAEPSSDDLSLVEPVEHPWRPAAVLTHIGRSEDHAQQQDHLVSANEQLAALRPGEVGPAGQAGRPGRAGLRSQASERARAGLRKAVMELLDQVREECAVRFGDRCQFTGRSVLAPGPNLRIGQIGLPEGIAWPLFSPLTGEQVGSDYVHERGEKIKRHVERVMRESVVIVNRAPTLRPTSITAFEPVMAPGRSILLHPLCCRLFDGDFDGDQAAVWLPITKAAQAEAREKLTVLAHLRRDPTVVVQHLTPAHAVLAGLAYAVEHDEGRAEVVAAWPAGCEAPGAPLTRGELVSRLLAAVQVIGPEALLDLVERLYRIGVRWATRSGGSLSPFIGEGLRLPPPPASMYPASWYAYASAVEAEIAAQADTDPTLRAPMRAVRCGARGSVRHLRALIGPWGSEAPHDFGGPIVHGFRDGMTAEEMWILAERTRNQLLTISQGQIELGGRAGGVFAPAQLPGEGSVLRCAMASPNPAAVFAEAADRNAIDPLTDPEVRLWVGLAPLPGD